MAYQIIKELRGFSACFRQWRAEGTHCKFLHGYGLYFRIFIEGDLDFRNWVFSFGDFKEIKEQLDDWFDHTVAVAEDDPELGHFRRLHNEGVIQLRTFGAVGTEKFAEYVHLLVERWIVVKGYKARCFRVECWENEKNCGVYESK